MSVGHKAATAVLPQRERERELEACIDFIKGNHARPFACSESTGPPPMVAVSYGGP